MGTMISKIVRTMSDIIAPLVFVYGAYVIIHGHMTPGGGFQGGAIFASGVGLLIVAFGAYSLQQKLKDKQVILLESTGSLMFIGLGLAGLAVTFFFNFLVGTSLFGHIPPTGANAGDFWTAGVLPLMNIAVGLKVIAGMAVVMLTIALATTEVKK